jgi:hypothetical protein
MRKLLLVIACFLIAGCSKKGHSYLQWPATLGGLEGFSEPQKERILGAISDLNLKIRRTVVAPQGLQTQDSSSGSDGSPIFIRFEQDIPEQKNVIAGRATVDGEKCVIQISSVVADNDDLLVPVLWHEVGHCAGLDHDPSKGEIMYKTTYTMDHYDESTLNRFFAKVLEASGLSTAN